MLKRFFDIIFSIIFLTIFLPLIFLLLIIVKLTSSGPSIFRQKRVGKNFRLFTIYKIRTMHNNSVSNSELTFPDDQRITKVGNFLRRYKLDELPQLFNILLGDMSFVGPRPETPYFVGFYDSYKKKNIFSIRPGLTDYSSLEMFNEDEFLKKYSNYEETYIKKILPLKQNNSVEYIKNQSLVLDITIIIKTFLKFFK